MNQEVAEFRGPRLPYHPEIENRYGVDKSGWKALVEAIYPSARTVDSVVMALSYCRARDLDPFKRPVHIVPMWDNNQRKYVETVWPGVSELRTTAFRTKQYAGCDEAEFGPDVTKEFSGTITRNNRDEEVTANVTFPEWCRVTVHRELHGRVCRFVGPKVFWTESYAKRGRADVPNDMWEKRPRGQLEKCAEAAALRKAFPEEIGNQYAAEEMDGQRIVVDEREQAATAIAGPPPPPPPPADRKPPPPPPPKPAARGVREPVEPRDAEQKAAFEMQKPIPIDGHDLTTGEVIDHEPQPEPEQDPAAKSQPAAPSKQEALSQHFENYDAKITDWHDRLKAASDEEQGEIWDTEIQPMIEEGAVMPPDQDNLKDMLRATA